MAESQSTTPENGHGLTDMVAAAGQMTAQVQDKVSTQAQHGADWFGKTLQENPLALGAAAVAFGAALGFLLPETAPENRLMGRARDRFAAKAQSAAQDLTHKASAVAHEAIDTALEAAKEEAKKQGLTA